MFRTLWREDAIIALNEIGFYIAEHNPYAVEWVIARIRDIADNLLPSMPRMYRQIASPVFQNLHLCALASPYLILYRVNDEEKIIEIVDIYHGAQDTRSPL